MDVKSVEEKIIDNYDKSSRNLDTELALMESEARFRALAEAAPALIFVYQDKSIRYVNSQFQKVTGYSEEECLKMKFWDFLHQDSRELARERGIARQKGENVPGRYEIKILSKGGQEIIGDLSVSLIEFECKPAVIGLIIDISEQKRGEKALRESEILYRTVFETTGTAMMIFEEDMRISLINKEFEILSGYSKEEVENKKLWTEFVAEDDIEKMQDFHQKRRIDPAMVPATYEFKFLDQWRSVKDIFITVDIIPGTLKSVVSFMDITERKKNEEEIRHLSFNDKLTGLYNRTFFEAELKRLDTESQLPLSLIMGDINGLKLINDALGYPKGDKLLKKIAEILKKFCRQEDIIARWGGDEFIILLPGTDYRVASDILKKIQKTANKYNPDLPFQISLSLGMASKNNYTQNIREVLKEAEDNLYRNKLFDSKSARSSFIFSLEKTLWTRSHETKEHCQRLREMAEKIGQAVSLADSDLDKLKLLSVLHDIGKIAVPNSILDKPGQLIPEEWETIKKHPETGYRIALSSPELLPIAEAILKHHERWDGKGYPLGLKGEEIPLLSRILALTDTYDVMIHGRPYKAAVNQEEVLNEIQRCAGTQFDPELANLFIRLISKIC